MVLSHPLPPASVRSRVAALLPWAAQADWAAMIGGRTNSAWKISGKDGQGAVLKLYRSNGQNPLFPNDPKAEAGLLVHLEGSNLAPSLIASFCVHEMDCNLYHALPGQTWTRGVRNVAALVKRLHQHPAPNGLPTVASGSEALQVQTQTILDLTKHGSALLPVIETDLVAPISNHVLLHCDLVPGNILETANGLRLIDWQCPAVGDATEDLAIFLSPAMQLLYRGTPLSASEEAAFLGNFSKDQQDRYAALAPIYHLRMAAYCLWQTERGNAAYADALDVELAALNAC